MRAAGDYDKGEGKIYRGIGRFFVLGVGGITQCFLTIDLFFRFSIFS